MLSLDPPGFLEAQDSTSAATLPTEIEAAAAAAAAAAAVAVAAGKSASLKSLATSNGATTKTTKTTTTTTIMDQTQTRAQVQAQMQAQRHMHTHTHTHILLVTGPAGCGKTTVAGHLAEYLKMPYIEGDSFHTPANVEKMRNGIPLTDEDRWDWLTLLREESMRQINQGSSGVILTCSALKRKYRDVIRVAAYYDHDLLIHFIFLDAPEELLLQRVMQRKGHYMGADMVHSQFDILELPSEDETDVITIDVSRDIEEVITTAVDKVSQIMSNQDCQ